MSKNTNKFSPRLYAEGLNVIGDNLLQGNIARTETTAQTPKQEKIKRDY